MITMLYWHASSLERGWREKIFEMDFAIMCGVKLYATLQAAKKVKKTILGTYFNIYALKYCYLYCRLCIRIYSMKLEAERWLRKCYKVYYLFWKSIKETLLL